MKTLSSVAIAALIAGTMPVFAQNTDPSDIDCTDPANAEHEDCLPGAADVTNFAPLIAGAVGLLGLGALAGGGSSTSTTATGTTGTN